MSALDALAKLGLSLRVDGDQLRITGLSSLSEGQVKYALRLANANKAEIVRELSTSQNALDELLVHLSQAPGVRLHFFTLEPAPTFTLKFDERASPEDCIKAQEIFFRAIDAIHFNAESIAKILKPKFSTGRAKSSSARGPLPHPLRENEGVAPLPIDL